MLRPLALALVLAVTGCGGGTSNTPAARTSAPSTPASGPPVALAGTTNDHGMADLSGAGGRASVTVRAGDFFFAPTYIQAQAGATVNVTVENVGAKPHTFTVPGGSADVTVQPGQRATATFALPTGAGLRFVCSFHVGGGMQGAFYSERGQQVPEARGSESGYNYRPAP